LSRVRSVVVLAEGKYSGWPLVRGGSAQLRRDFASMGFGRMRALDFSVSGRSETLHLKSGILLLSLAGAFLVSLAIPRDWSVVFFLVLIYSNFIPTMTVALGYHSLRGSHLSRAATGSIALLSVFLLPISVIYYVPLAAVATVVTVLALVSWLLQGSATRVPWLAMVATILWPAAMIATVVLYPWSGVDSLDVIITGNGVAWAVLGLEMALRAYDAHAPTHRTTGLRGSNWITALPLGSAIGMAALPILAFSFRTVPNFGLWDRSLDVLVVTVGIPLAMTGSCHLLAAFFGKSKSGLVSAPT
jgi:hypothetical protein